MAPEKLDPADGPRAVALVGQLGVVFVMPIVAGALFGLWLERRYGGGPLVIVGMLALGVASGVVSAYRVLKPFLK